MAISDRTSYGVPAIIYQSMQNDIATIFEFDTTWEEIDKTCMRYSIEAIVINDLDPLWNRLHGLEIQRNPLYQNQYYSVIPCGDQ